MPFARDWPTQNTLNSRSVMHMLAELDVIARFLSHIPESFPPPGIIHLLIRTSVLLQMSARSNLCRVSHDCSPLFSTVLIFGCGGFLFDRFLILGRGLGVFFLFRFSRLHGFLVLLPL